MFRLLSQLFSFIGNVIYLLSYPFLWVIGILLFVILRIGLYPIISWMLASWFFILNHYYGFNSEIAIPFTGGYIETGNDYAVIVLVIIFALAPFFASQLYRFIFPRGLFYFIIDPLSIKFRKVAPISRPKKKQKKQKPYAVKVIVPTLPTEGISHIVTRLPPHLQRFISGVDLPTEQQRQEEEQGINNESDNNDNNRDRETVTG